MLLKDLQQLGFTKNTATVYLTLFELGEAKAGQIVRKTGMHRNLIYRALEELEQKKMITRTEKRGVALFKMLDPSHILNELKEKENLAEHIIETLRTSYQQIPQEVIVREGKSEVESFYITESERLSSDDEWLLIGLASEWFINNPKYFDQYVVAHKKAGYQLKSIVGEMRASDMQLIERARIDLPGMVQVKVNPEIIFESVEINILPDKIVICIFIEPYTIIEIRNEKFVEGYRAYFSVLWNQEVATYRGWNDVEMLFNLIAETQKKTLDPIYTIGGNFGLSGNDQKVADFWIRYGKKRVIAGAEDYTLFYERHRAEAERERIESGDTTLHLSHVRFLPDSYYSPLQIHVVGKKAIITFWGNEPSATVYERPEIVAAFKKQFDLLWNQDVRVYTGWQELRTLFFEGILPHMKPGMTEYVMASGYDIPDDEQNQKEFAQFFLEYNSFGVKQGFTKYITIGEVYREQLDEEMKQAGDTGQYAHTRFIPNIYGSPLETHVFPDRAVLIAWKGTPTATVYYRPDMIEGFKKQFDVLWKIGIE